VTVEFRMVMGYSTILASILQVSIVRVAVQLSSIAEECRVVRRIKGAPVEFCDIVMFIEKMIVPLPVNKSSACVVEEQLKLMPAPGTFPSHVPSQK